jgi:diazepam-binding inhibitor (GABA receptor modulating acyl-CoA-binding protein)
MFDLKGKYKWESWDGNKGKSKETAQKEYVALVQELKSKQ